MYDTIVIKGVEYVAFSVEKYTEGGRYSKKELGELLKEKGIKYNYSHAYSPYVGQFGIFIEKSKEKEVEELLWG